MAERETDIESMNTYTFFLEYAGGTYIAQINALDFHTAIKNWIDQIDYKVIHKADKRFKDKLLESLNESPTLLEGFDKVWCLTGLIDENVAIIHFTQTSSD